MNINTDKIILHPNSSVNINNSLTYYPLNSDFNTLYYNKEYFINKTILYSGDSSNTYTNLNFYYIPISELPQLTENNQIVLNIKLSYISKFIPESDIRYNATVASNYFDNNTNFINATFTIINNFGTIFVSNIYSTPEIICLYSDLNSSLDISLSNSISLTPQFLFRDTFLTAHIQILSFNKERESGL